MLYMVRKHVCVDTDWPERSPASEGRPAVDTEEKIRGLMVGDNDKLPADSASLPLSLRLSRDGALLHIL